MELGVALQQQFRSLGVVLHSQLQHARATAYLTLYSVRPKLAQAALAERRAVAEGSSRAAAEAAALSGAVRYAAQLGAAYALAPVPALLLWMGLRPAFGSGGAAGIAGGVLLLMPSLVHLAHGAALRAWLALATLLGYVALGSAGGAALGRTLGRTLCDPQTQEDCGLTVLGWLLLGAAAGGAFAYCAHAVRHVRLAARSGDVHAPRAQVAAPH
jgi:hypothetical protein